MRDPVEQISEDDVIIGQQQMDRTEAIHDDRPASFEDYLRMNGGIAAFRRPRRTRPEITLAELAFKAKSAPRDG